MGTVVNNRDAGPLFLAMLVILGSDQPILWGWDSEWPRT